MSFFNTAAKPPRSKRPLGLDERRTAQHEQGVTIPVWWGTQRVGVIALVEPFNRITKPAEDAKKFGKTPGDYYASVAMVIGHGPLDVLREIWVDQELWWSGTLEREVGEDSVPITIEDFGSGTLYWGTTTQTTDATLAAFESGHPAYRGIAYLVFPEAFLGQSRDTVPHFEVVASRWGVFPEGWTRLVASNGLDANPMDPVVEVITNPRLGRGLVDVTLVDLDNLAAAAAFLNDEGMTLSPILDNQMTLRAFLSELGEYVDGWFRTDGSGRLIWGLVRNSGEWGPVLSEPDMLAEPVVRVGSWLDTASAAQVVYTNAQRYWMPEVVVGVDSAQPTITGILRQPVIERRWITDPSVAARLADVIAQRNGRPWSTGTLSIRPSQAADLAPGSILRISYGHLGLVGQLVRVVSMDTPDPGNPALNLEFSFDVGVLNGSFADPPTYTAPTAVALTPVAATYQALWPLPAALGGSDQYPAVALLCAQPTRSTDAYYGHIDVGGGTYDSIEPEFSTAFSVRAQAKTSAGTSGGFDVELLGVDTDLTRFSATDYTAGRVVAWVGGETMIVTGASLVSAGRYTLSVTRGAFSTTAAAVSINDPVWLVNKARLYKRLVEVEASTSVTMKIQPAIRGHGVDLADCTALSVTVDPADVAPLPPTDLEVNGSSTPTWTGTDDLLITWTPTEPFGPRAVRLQFWDVTGVTLLAQGDFTVGSVDFLCLYEIALEALAGPAVSFKVRAAHRSGTNVGAYANVNVTR